MLISQPYRNTVKREAMKNTKINRDQAITIIKNIWIEGCSIPMASIGNGGSGLCYVSQPPSKGDLIEFNSALKSKAFRIVPTSEISEEFGGFHFSEDYDVCVEFSSMDGSNPSREQFLLWNIDYFKDKS